MINTNTIIKKWKLIMVNLICIGMLILVLQQGIPIAYIYIYMYIYISTGDYKWFLYADSTHDT